MVLTRQRCLIHVEREAAARCGRCGRFFCRECVTEHHGAMTCAACLREMAATAHRGPLKPHFWLRPTMALLRTGALLAGIVTTCLFFHLLGRFLLATPDEFHAGTLWKAVSGAGTGDED